MSRRSIPAAFDRPDEITIRGETWRVRYADGDLVARDIHRDGKARGYCYREEREIHLARAAERSQAVTLIHELLHACSDEPIPHADEERFIVSVERPLYEALAQLRWRR